MPLPRAREPAGDRGRGEHRGAEALERERRGEPHAVELGLRLQPYTRAGRLKLELVAQARCRVR